MPALARKSQVRILFCKGPKGVVIWIVMFYYDEKLYSLWKMKYLFQSMGIEHIQSCLFL